MRILFITNPIPLASCYATDTTRSNASKRLEKSNNLILYRAQNSAEKSKTILLFL